MTNLGTLHITVLRKSKSQENFTDHMNQAERSTEVNSSTDLDDSVLAVSHEGQRHHESTNRPKFIEVRIDTGATKSVIGLDYLNSIVDKLSETVKQLILKEKEGKKLEFRFGNGMPTSTLKVIHMPVNIQGEKRKLKFYSKEKSYTLNYFFR